MLKDRYISPATLLDLVWNTAPFLQARLPSARPEASPLELAGSADGFLHILAAAAASRERRHATPEAELLTYFALCLAAHHATVATYVPTDVDTKIRGGLWVKIRESGVLRAAYRLTESMHGWSLADVSRRTIACGEHGIVSGHDGEWLSVAIAAHGRFIEVDEHELVARSHAAIHHEIVREARAFVEVCLTPGRELDTLRLAASIIHNLGDVNQGMGAWSPRALESASSRQFSRLAQENADGYGGIFRFPAELYRELLASEGHRHYPLRAVKALRVSPDLLLPLGPFLDDFGATLATSAALDRAGRGEALDALAAGCKKVPGQNGYYRAIAGFREASSRAFGDASEHVSSASRKLLKDAELRRKIAVPRRSFESTYVKRVERMRRDHGEAMRSAVVVLL